MARSVDVDFSFEASIEVKEVLCRLLDGGMRPFDDGTISYLIDEDGMFEWRKVAASGLREVTAQMGNPAWGDRVVGITLFFPDSDRGGDLLFHPGRTTVSYVVSVNPKLLPDSSRFCDIGWYLSRLVPLVEPLGLEEVEVRDSQ